MPPGIFTGGWSSQIRIHLMNRRRPRRGGAMRRTFRPISSRGAARASSNCKRAAPGAPLGSRLVQNYCFGGMKVGPTERIGLFSDEVVAVPASAGGVAAGAFAVGGAGAAPFLAFAGAPL